MEPDLSRYVLEGDNSMYADAHGLVVPVVTRAGYGAGRHRAVRGRDPDLAA